MKIALDTKNLREANRTFRNKELSIGKRFSKKNNTRTEENKFLNKKIIITIVGTDVLSYKKKRKCFHVASHVANNVIALFSFCLPYVFFF